ncbi:CRISPR-associated helicase Cas3' [Pseudobacter ginsenosidimutans]|uniref:CRISPR-associated Cas3 family helicase n=1 Tax=Pseudobacter ginsenosidimutans TaxID=661488 RepID=A0A4Q7MWX6_9BACT|nr:CRISPR-associated helicase Cas3' [Pseudobacter ginsenosidimutans]QEC40713.1 CRISPR-associated helicase Cas3' [Pseudobacter ginsenosidimutans]RZS72569.1 CRISPR-associated Cas3 family helicase [Pseudobacter ginsenosidimutans]
MSNHYFDRFFAKSDGVTTLEMHTRHVITAGKNLLQSLPLNTEEKIQWEEKLVRMAVLHDLGKIHKSFVGRLNGQNSGEIRHELVSLLFCINYLQLDDNELFAIATHHKGIVDTLSEMKGTLSIPQVSGYIEQWYELDKSIFEKENVQNWLNLFGLGMATIQQDLMKELPKNVKMFLNARYQKKVIQNWEQRKLFSLSRALLMAADHLGSARKENDIPKYKQLTIKDFQPNKAGILLPFRPFQEQLRRVTTDIILHAPTGSGKTEAALNWVFANQTENSRVFYLLPYTASINAMVSRLQKHYNEEVVTALHSKTLDFFYEQISQEYSNDKRDYQKLEREAKNRKSLSKELFYPVKVATLHQILKTSLKGKGWEFSLFDYKNALFIIDEFHTYDALLTGMLLATIKLFRKLFNAKFFFLSATIPEFMLQLIINEIYGGDQSKLIRPDRTKEQDRLVLDRKRHQLYCMNGATIENEISLIKSYLEDARSVLIIVNNVKTAQRLFKEIKFSGTVQLLHSGFNKRDRTEIEKAITNKDVSLRPQLLIATQAVEVSLDINYDIAFIENAPIDALIQRFGRINRGGEKRITPIDRDWDICNDTVPVYVFENSIGKTPFYDKKVLEDTWINLLKLNNCELGEDDLINVCNEVYKEGYNEVQQKDFVNGIKNSIINEFEEDWIAGHWRDWVGDVLTNNNQKIEVLCFNLIEEFQSKIAERRFLEANQLLVQVYRYEAEISKNRKPGETLVAINIKYDRNIGYYSIDKDLDEQFDI